MTGPTIEQTSTGPLFATFPRRLKAVAVDGFVCVLVFLGPLLLLDYFEPHPSLQVVVYAACMLFLLFYEPVLVAWKGRTVGHRALNLKVVADDPGSRLPFWKAVLRWMLKTVGGIVSFVTMAVTPRNQALHDLAFGTTVQIDDITRARPGHYITERPVPSGPLPSRRRRILVATAWSLALFLIMIVVSFLALSTDCIENDRCSTGDKRLEALIDIVWIGATALLCGLAAQGRIWGCRRTASAAESLAPSDELPPPGPPGPE